MLVKTRNESKECPSINPLQILNAIRRTYRRHVAWKYEHSCFNKILIVVCSWPHELSNNLIFPVFDYSFFLIKKVEDEMCMPFIHDVHSRRRVRQKKSTALLYQANQQLTHKCRSILIYLTSQLCQPNITNEMKLLLIQSIHEWFS